MRNLILSIVWWGLINVSYSLFNNQVKFLSENGHLYIIGADNGNITLKTKNGYVNINDQNVVQVARMARIASEKIERFQSVTWKDMELNLMALHKLITDPGGLTNRIELLEGSSNVTVSRDTNDFLKRRVKRLNRRVTEVERRIQNLQLLLLINECESNPCHNGGSCVDIFNGFLCQCPDEWEGPTCSVDVNECARFAGSTLGCQNGATCVNIPGSYNCKCPNGWYGLHCTQRIYDCSRESSRDLCGHGICIPQGGTGRGFACICDPGWTVDPSSGSCTIDRDECKELSVPCSHDPPVECINTPGSFRCASCPHGYTGNGYQCRDVDECLIENGGCSVMPRVQCINTRGSRVCGMCPPGYIGNGVACTFSGGLCSVNNGGCHPQATCTQSPGLNYVQCNCPAGWVGSGIGENGCLPFDTANKQCASNPCKNGGTCIPSESNSFQCHCAAGFSGPTCNSSPCDPNPCMNGGNCLEVKVMGVNTFTCSCSNGYTGNVCDVKEQVHGESCIASIVGLEGVLKWPSLNSVEYRPGRKECEWKIKSSNNSLVLKIKFTDFQISDRHGSCVSHYIEIYDGTSLRERMNKIGRYCNGKEPTEIISSQSSAQIVYTSSSTLGSFSLNWTTVEPSCGGTINASIHGTISYPKYGSNALPNKECHWIFRAPYGKRIQFTFFSLSIKAHLNCTSGFLKVFDGDSIDSPVLAEYCNETIPAPLVTSDHKATIISFSSDSYKEFSFQVAYAPIEGMPGCGGVLTGPTGHIFSPAGPAAGTYNENLNCEWKIQLPLNERIRIKFQTFNIESNDKCKYDYLKVFDGPTTDSALIGKWCGSAVPLPFTSSTNVLTVFFHSDFTYNSGGFQISYITVCGGTFSDQEGIIHSPYYPAPYPDDRVCEYTIVQPLGRVISLTFLDFDLEEDFEMEDCPFDYVKIFDGHNDKAHEIGEYCGSSLPPQILSSFNYLHITFKTDENNKGRGFRANYTSMDLGCGGILTEKSGFVTSPKYPDHYPPLKECKWFIHAPEDYLIQLTWLAFNIEYSSDCRHDWVEIYEKSINSANRMGPRYCGSSLPPVVTSATNIVVIVFHTDMSSAQPGFRANYIATPKAENCGGNFHSTMGSISSPYYPDNYANNMDCTWTITVPHGQQIMLTVESFNLESQIGCTFGDILEIRNGGYVTSPLIKRYCNTIDKEIMSMTNQLYLRFTSDSSITHSGFLIKWNGAQRGCGGSLTSASGSIISPNYPQPYGKNGNCYWRISVAMGSSIQLTVVDLELEEHSTCSLDYIELFDGIDKRSPSLGRYCSSDINPSIINSKTNHMFIKFRSDMTRQGRGFHLKYNTVCNRTVTGFRGVIESPNFPDNEPFIKECIWKISAPAGNAINITFSHFSMLQPAIFYAFYPRLSNCSYIFLEVTEGAEYKTPSNQLGKFCGSSIPPKISSSLNNVYIRLKSNSYILSNIFRLEWVVSGCGGMFIDKPSGEFKSPGYPIPYNHSLTCEWYITVESRKSVQITIKDLELEIAGDCLADSLIVYSGPDDTAPMITRLCSSISQPSVLTTSGNYAFVRFQSDETSHGKGFIASFITVDSRCGGTFVAESGSIHSVNYPQNYDLRVDCMYFIKVEKDRRVNLTFEDFDIVNSENCSSSYVKVYDGNSLDSPLLLTHCGNKLPNSVVSSNNEMLLRMKSDGFYAAKGFLASYKPLCGANIVTSGRGTINYAEGSHFHIDDSDNCSWIIRASELNAKITLHFVVLSIGSSSSETNSIDIYAGDDVTSPLITSISGHVAPPTITVSSSVVLVVYKQSYSTDIFGQFVLDYSVLDSVCGSDLSSENGIITSPNFPDSYPRNIECVWNLQASPGNSVNFGFLQFNLPFSQACNEDYVEIREGDSGGKLLGIFCGNTLPQNISVGEHVWLKFKSSEDEQTALGFSAAYSLAYDNEITGTKGVIASPLYPLKYKNNGLFTWRVTVKLRQAIKVSFNDVYVLDGECNSEIVVYDGYDSSAQILIEACLPLPEPKISSSNVIFIEFQNYHRMFGTSFLLDWEEVSKVIPETTIKKDVSCVTRVELSGVRGNNNSYDFTSPGFPNGYGHNLHCTWIIETVPQNHLSLNFKVLDLEKSWQCHADYISVYTVVPGSKNEWDKMYTLCHSNSTLEYYQLGNIAKIVFDTDFYDNRTGFAAVVNSVCGGSVTGPVGVLTNNGWGIMVCKWYITVRLGHTINVTFTNFNMPIPPGEVTCKRNYVLLRNGGSETSPFLGVGKYCGTTPPMVPISTSNKLYVEVVVETSQQVMELTYKEVSVECGDDITLTKWNNWTVISSPNYPNIPPPHIECVWRVMAPSGESIHFEITDRFDMTVNRGCTKEYLELRDGATDSSHLIGRYCSVPSFKVTKGNTLYVKYFTDVKDPRDGFRARISMSKCGGTIYNSRSGSIQSPGYPSSYDADMFCEWRLVASERFIYNFQFKDLKMGPRTYASCENVSDTVTIADVDPGRPNDNGSYSQTFCGKNSLDTFKTMGNIAVVTFKSGKQPLYSQPRIFSIDYRATLSGCGGSLNLPSGQIMSPGYPTYSKGNSYCMWRITAPYDRKVTFTVEDFDLNFNPTNISSWGSQQLDFYNGFRFSNPLASWQGQKPGGTVVESSGNKMMIFYRIKYSTSHRGFKGKYTTDKPADCGGMLDGRNGTISLLNKNTSFYCEWAYMKASESSNNTFVVEIVGTVSRHTESECDLLWYPIARIKVSSGYSTLGGFCSKSTRESPFRIISPYQDTVIQAYNSVDNTDANTVNITMSWKVNDCGGVIVTPTKTIMSPNYPQPYPQNVDCTWFVNFPNSGERISVHFENFNLENDCNNDYLLIRNGGSPKSPEIGKYCGTIVPADIISQHDSLWISFHSNDKTQASGFKITLTTVSQGCGGIIHDPQGLLHSPNYPVPYKNNIECDWEIRVDQGLHIGLTFPGRFYIEDSPNCQNDFIEVSDYVGGVWKPMGRVCGRPLTAPVFNTTSNRMRVLFRTNDKIVADGFTAEWSTNCGSVIEVNGPGKIHSPGYPKNYEGPLDCNYTIIAPGKILSAKFNAFQLEGGRAVGCIYDVVVIYTYKDSGRYGKFGTYCGHFLPPSFTSKGMFGLHFVADTWASNTGFELEYNVEVCGGAVTSETSISPPKFNEKYFPNMYCVWNITAPKDQVIIIKFSKFYVSSSLNCLRDFLLIFDTSNSSSNSTKLLGKICGNFGNAPPVFRTSGNSGQMIFSTDQFYNTEGFTAIISFKQACGGHKEVGSSLNLISPDFDKNGKYEPLMDCHWILKAPPQNTILLNFKKFDISNCSSQNISNQACGCDYIEIFDGPSESDELLGRYCTGKEPKSIASSSQYLSIKFSSDELYEAGGFEIQVTPLVSQCGPSIHNVTQEPQELTSPGYPNNYPNNINCIWLFVTQSYGDIDIHFNDLDLEPSESCSADRLEIRGLNSFQRFDSYISEGTGKDKIFIGRTNSLFFQNPSVYFGSRMSVTTSTFCGHGKLMDYYSTFRQVRLRFISNEQVSSKGFKLTYSIATCTRNFTSEQGRILKSRLVANCYLTVIAPDPNATVSLYFSDISLVYRDQCLISKLQVFDGLTDTSPLLTTACGHQLPSPVFSTGRNILIKFTNTPGNSYMASFDITYTTTTKGRGCGGTIFNYGGIFSSPFYPGNYRNNTICRWDISVPVGNIIAIKFMEFDLGVNTCETDFVELFDVDTSSGVETLRSRFCGGSKPAMFEGLFGAAVVKYQTSVHNSGIGWLARFMSKVAPVAGNS